MDCTASGLKWFDTYSSTSRFNEAMPNRGTTQDFINYFTGLATNTVLLGISCDDAYSELSSALPMLRAAGVDVDDVDYSGMFAFILQKGYPEKTVLVKKQTSESNDKYNCAALGLNVSITGGLPNFISLISQEQL